MSKHLLRIAAVMVMTLGLTGCGESYRYKLTLAVNTPQGVKRASSVVEIQFWNVSIPAKGTMHKLRGEALYLDLGPGARPLIALLTKQLHQKYGKDIRWSFDGGPSYTLLSELYGVKLVNGDLDVAQISKMRGPRQIKPADLPDLVTFANVNDPKTVIELDPNNLEATLGPGITWEQITLESTDEPVTKGIVTKLPWLPAFYRGMLDGQQYSTGATLANTLSTANFDQSGDLHD